MDKNPLKRLKMKKITNFHIFLFYFCVSFVLGRVAMDFEDSEKAKIIVKTPPSTT